jgi:DNA-directed RNA polymerase specialized sigma24 family protein
MRELEGRSYEEIAALSRCHLGPVNSRLSRAPHACAERLARYLD